MVLLIHLILLFLFMVNPFPDLITQLLPEPQASLLMGMIFGVRESLPKTLYQDLITTGTIHIVALSGQNITILTGFISALTLSLGRKISILVTVLAIVAFVWFVGGEPSVVRAAIMGSMQLLSIYFGKRYWSLLSLLLASLVMLLVNPAWIDEVSFQLSFLATLGIILFGQTKPLKPASVFAELKHDFRANLRLSLVAQLATLPVIVTRFHRVSLIAPLTNILIAPIIAPVMMWGMVAVSISLFSLPLALLAAWVVWVPLSYLVWIVSWTARIPYASISF